MYFLKQNTQVYEKFQEFKALVETQTGKNIKVLRNDNGKEFINQRMNKFLKLNGLQHQLTLEYTPEQNDVAERANRSICEKTTSMLNGLQSKF